MKTQKIALMLMVAILICGCSSAEEDQEKEQIKDQDTSILTSCSSDAVTNVSISTVSWDDTSQICDKMARTIGANPSMRSLRALSKSVYAMYLKGNTTALADNAYQFMRVVESRGQLHDDAAMINTFDVLFVSTSLIGTPYK